MARRRMIGASRSRCAGPSDPRFKRAPPNCSSRGGTRAWPRGGGGRGAAAAAELPTAAAADELAALWAATVALAR